MPYKETTKHPKKEDYNPKSKKTENKEAKEKIKETEGKPKDQDFKIYGVKKKMDFLEIKKDLPRPLHTMLERGGGAVLIAAPPGSGKSNLLSNLFLRDEFFKDMFEGGFYVISPTAKSDLTSEHLMEYADFVEEEMTEDLLTGIHQNIMAIPKEDRQLSCILMDDCMGSRAMRQYTVLNKMISSNRHMKTLFMFSTQSIKSLNPNLRSCLSHSIIFYQPSNKQFNDCVELHSFFGGEEEFIKNYNIACNPKYGFALCDWRDLKMYAWGAELDEPQLLWSRYDEDGNISKNDKDPANNQKEVNGEVTKGKLKTDN